MSELAQVKDLFVFKKVRYKFLTNLLGTCTEAELYNEHVLKKAQKEIAKANKLQGKMIKSLEKYKDVEISADKEASELKAILRAYQEKVGKRDPLPDNVTDLLSYAKEINEEYEALMSKGEEQKSTVFMRDEDGHAIISTHMIIGNFKENLKSMVNNSEKGSMAVKSKVSAAEIMSTDVKVVEDFTRPSMDILRHENGKAQILERPIRFERMGKTVTAIALSEQIPAGAEIEFTLRIRKGSPVLDVLPELLEMGKLNGLGQWRGSGKMGLFVYKIEDCENPGHKYEKDGWN
jgi:LEA14-like dessication related protein